MSEPTTEAGREAVEPPFNYYRPLILRIEAEARASLLASVRASIAEVRDHPALDGVMGMSWEAIEQAITRA